MTKNDCLYLGDNKKKKNIYTIKFCHDLIQIVILTIVITIYL